MFLLNKADELFLTNKLESYTGEFLVLEKKAMPRATPKKLAHHCYYNDILFQWSHNNYYIKRG